MAGDLVVSTGASDSVPITQDAFLVVAGDAITNARDALDTLGKRQYISGSTPSVGQKPEYNYKYNAPAGAPTWDYSQGIPQWENIPLNLNAITKSTVEDTTGDPPPNYSADIPPFESIQPPPAPGYAPVVDDVVIPDPPVLASIADPKEWAIAIPPVPALNIPEFTATPPSIGGISPPSDDFVWSEEEYQSALLDNTVSLIERFNAGGVVIPDDVWEALWAKDNDRENRAGEKLIDEINEEWSSRGFNLPQGVQAAQIQEVRQNIQSTAAGRSRDIAIKEADLNIENLKFAVAQGIAMENLRGGWYQQALTRMLDALKYTYSLSVEIYNAQISFYNAQLQAYQTQAMVYKTELEAETIKLELYKTELEGQKIIGDLNMQQVQIYTAKVEALNTEINLYNATLNGLKIGVEIDATRIDAYAKEVQAYGAQIQAISVQYDAYKTQMEGAKIGADIYDSSVKSYATRVEAYSSKVDAEAKSVSTDIEINKLLIEEYNTKLKAYTTEVAASMETLKAEVSTFEAAVKAYDVDVVNEKTRVTVLLEELKSEIEVMAQGTRANVANAEVDTQVSIAEAQLSVEAMKQVASTEGALAGSAMSAVNISQSMSDNANNSASAT